MKKINARVSPPAHRSKNTYLPRIIAKSPPVGQSRRYKRLIQAVRKRELTTSLEILDESGIAGDLALFVLANLQALEVTA